MTDKKNMQDEKDSPPHSDPKGVNPTGTGPGQPSEKGKDKQPGAANAGSSAGAEEDTYD